MKHIFCFYEEVLVSHSEVPGCDVCTFRIFNTTTSTMVYNRIIDFFFFYSFKRFIDCIMCDSVQISISLGSLFVHARMQFRNGSFADIAFAMKIRVSCRLLKSLFISFCYVVCGDFKKIY